jgi:hypothetical protein
MCSRTTCGKCQKPTWAGCGRHIEEALAGVPHDQRCKCRDEAGAENRGGFFARRRGR